MNNYESNKLKRSIVAKTWLAEKLRICNGEGTRDWCINQQDNILKYNYAIGFVGQFLNENMKEDNVQVQFVEMSIEFLFAHYQRKENKKTGYINTTTFEITPLTTLPVIKLSEPVYLGYFDTHRSYFVGYDIGFGLKVASAKTNNRKDVDLYKKKFGLDCNIKQDDFDTSDFSQQRMKKYGF